MQERLFLHAIFTSVDALRLKTFFPNLKQNGK